MPDSRDETHDGREGRVVRLPSRPRPGQGLDAIIVGGGVIGMACAWRAARRGLRVRVLERDRIGSGASAVAAGMLAPAGEATWGEEPLLEMTLAAAAAWPRFAAELTAESGEDAEPAGEASALRATGSLHVALDRDEAEELRRRHDLMRSHLLDVEWLRGSECRRLEPGLSTACAGGIRADGEAAVDPSRVVALLRRAAEAAGAEVHEEAEVVTAQMDGARIAGIRTADDTEHRAPHVVLAAGAWSGSARWLPAAARPAVRPVKGEILTLRGAEGETVSDRIVVTERVYLVPRADGRLIVGATVEERGFDTRNTAGGVHELLREAYRALPEVAELEFVEARAGLRPGTPDNLPLIGRGAIGGLILATGHWRNGVLLAPTTADAVAELLAGGEVSPELAAADPSRLSGREPAPPLAPVGEPGS